MALNDPDLYSVLVVLSQALSAFRKVPHYITKRTKKNMIIPPEAYALLRSKEISLITRKYFQDSHVINLAMLKSEQLNEFVWGLFWPSLEVSYLWNGFFQIKERRLLLEELEQSIKVGHPFLTNHSPNFSRYMNMYHLFRGALLREERMYTAADVELAKLCPKPEAHGVEGREPWTVEFAKYERGLTYFAQGDRKKAHEFWNAVRDSGHPMDARLKFRVRTALRRG